MAIRHKRKSTSGYTWQSSDLVDGQIGVNTADGSLHIKKSDNSIAKISGVVKSVTGDAVDNTDPENPVINSAGGGRVSLLGLVPVYAATGTAVVQVPGFAMVLSAGTWRIDASLTLSTTSVVSAARGGINLLAGGVDSACFVINTPTNSVSMYNKPVTTAQFVAGGSGAISANTGSAATDANFLNVLGTIVTSTGCTIGVQITNEVAADTTGVVAGSNIVAEKIA